MRTLEAEEAIADDVTDSIARFAASLPDDYIGEGALAAVVNHVVDAIGCAVAATGEPPPRIARAAAHSVRVEHGGASVVGLVQRTSMEWAAFANACMVRCLDFNDTYDSLTGGHPSDMVAGILAVAEQERLSGSAVIRGVFVAYEVFAGLADAVPLRDSGWDQGAFVGVACAAGIAAAMALDVQTAAHAVSLAITTGVPLRVTRAGMLSAWKGCATAYAVMVAVFAVRLARLGMAGPARPFRGQDGFMQSAVGQFDLRGLGEPRTGGSAAERTGIKFLPVEWGARAPVETLLELRCELPLQEIVAIEVLVPEFVHREIGGGRGDMREKWDPKTRETADHSLPYLLAVALADGEITLESFDRARIQDPRLRPLMSRVRVSPFAVTDRTSSSGPAQLAVELRDGTVVRRVCGIPRGDPGNAPEDEEIDGKFVAVTSRVVGKPESQRLLSLLRGLQTMKSVDPVMGLLRCVG